MRDVLQMNRSMTYLLGPEGALVLFSALLFWFCSRHNSGEGRDLALMEKLIWPIPFIITPISFSTIRLALTPLKGYVRNLEFDEARLPLQS